MSENLNYVRAMSIINNRRAKRESRRRNMKLYVADRETGTFIEEVRSIIEGENLIRAYETRDKEDGAFTENFYDIVDAEHLTVEQNTTLFADHDNGRYFEVKTNNGSGLNWCIEYTTDEDGFFIVKDDDIGMTDRELAKLDKMEV